MNKATQREIESLKRLCDLSGMVQTEHCAYAARSITSLHRAAGPKVQREIEIEIDRMGLWSSIRTTNGVLTALDD